MSVEDILVNRVELEIDGKKMELSLKNSGCIYLAKKYGSAVKAFARFRELGDGSFEFTEDQCTIIADLLYATGRKYFKDRDEVDEYIEVKNLSFILIAIGQAIKDNLPKSEDNANPQKP